MKGCCKPRLPPSCCLCRMEGPLWWDGRVGTHSEGSVSHSQWDGKVRTPSEGSLSHSQWDWEGQNPLRGLSVSPPVLSLRSRGFGQSNSLPTAGSAGAGLARRNPRQFQIPSRNLPTARLGLLGPTGLLGTPQRSPAASPAILKQGRQVGWHSGPFPALPSLSHQLHLIFLL